MKQYIINFFILKS